jgi:protein involved in ribonucleotide reduction
MDYIHLCNNCNKQYFSVSGLWYHKQKCVVREEIRNEKENVTDIVTISNTANTMLVEQDIRTILMDLVKQNQELQQQVINLSKEKRQEIHTGAITNNSKNFNINFFLNETCKNAMNLSEFVNSIHVDLMDFEMTGKQGYVEGITQIIKKSLKKLDIVERPMHCTDVKREIIYVKDDDKWEKESNDKTSKLSRVINHVADKNLRLAVDWQHKYPDCQVNNTAANHELVSMMPAIFGGISMTQIEKHRAKIVSILTKEIIVEKSITLV